jgi:DNA-binding winged helix-turn-helix (wHTH) protein
MQVSFGALVLDSDTRELLRDGVPVSLSPKAFELLCLLVAHRPKAMAKSELQERLWPDTFVVEKNLANLIGEIRAAIGDDPSNPRFIRTVHRFGYAFREPASSAASSPDAGRRGGVSFLVKWAAGRVPLGEGTHVIGRDPDVEILLDSPGVSRRHARITIAGGSATIEDLGSKNGTFVGDERLERARSLDDGDTFSIGSVQLTLNVRQAPNSTETEASPYVTGLRSDGQAASTKRTRR